MHPWCEEFYPVEAQAATESDSEALRHSLLKWQGLRPENLAKHDLMAGHFGAIQDLTSFDPPLLYVDGSSCALCQRYPRDCSRCPLTKANDGTPCTGSKGLLQLSPWRHFLLHKDPEPMIALIERAIAQA